MKSDKRKAPRKPLRYAARIALDDGSRKSCWLSDISHSGARIDVDDADNLPAKFVLLLAGPNGPRRDCTVVWRENGQVGVEFRRGAIAAFGKAVRAPLRNAPRLVPDQDADATPAPADADAGGN